MGDFVIVGGVLVVVVHGADTFLSHQLIDQSLIGRADYCIQMVVYLCLADIAIIMQKCHFGIVDS